MSHIIYVEQLEPTFMPWPTPTPYPTSEATPVIQTAIESIQAPELAERIVSGYQFMNQHQFMDMVFWALLLVMVIGGAYNIIKQLRDA